MIWGARGKGIKRTNRKELKTARWALATACGAECDDSRLPTYRFYTFLRPVNTSDCSRAITSEGCKDQCITNPHLQ